MQHFEFLAAAEWTPERMGQITGGLLVLVIQLLGIAKCVQIMRRPTTSKACVGALLLLLSGWFLSSLGAALGLTSDAFLEGTTKAVTGMAGVVLVFGALFLILVALVLGIVGLATYDKSRFTQGRAQAVWTLVLASLMVMSSLAAAVFAAIRSQGDRVAGSASPGKTILNTGFNFSITPSGRWIPMKVNNESACMAMRRANPEHYFMVIGESVGDTLNLTGLKEASMANLAGASEVLEQKEETVKLDGVEFVRVTSRVKADKGGLQLDYEHWIGVDRGFGWQFVFWCVRGGRDQAAQAQAVMDTFRVLDRTKQGLAGEAAKDAVRPMLGYRTKIADLGWLAWEDPEKNALEDFCVQRTNEALMVVPVRFDTEPPDLEALTRGLLHTLGFHDTAEEDFETAPWTPGHGGTGRELLTEREVDGTRYRYILRVARHGKGAHLVAGWAAVPKGDLDLVRRSLDAITLSAPAGPAPTLTEAQETALSLVLNQAAISLVNRGLHEAAVPWFMEGFTLSKDPVILGNAGDAYERAEKPAEGRDLLAPHMKDFPANHYLGLCFARLQVLSGEADAGAQTFLRLLDRGLKNEDDLLSWLSLLSEQEHYPQALRCAEAWVAKNPTVNARRWQAQTFGASGDAKQAVALLEKLHSENPKDAKITLDLGRYWNDLGEHAKAAELAEKVLADSKESTRALMVLGWSQMGRKWYRDAKATFERAAKKQPDDEDIQDAIRQASAMLGQGDNSGIREPIEAVAVPDSVAAALTAQPVPPDFGGGHSSAWLMRATGWHFEKGRPLRRTMHRRVKVLTAEGARDFSSVEVSFDPLSERVFMNRLEVKDASGAVVAKADVSDAYVRDLDDDTATNLKLLHLQVAGVQPGRTVEWEVTVEDRSSSDVFAFQRHLFANSLPVAAEAVFVTGDVPAVKAELAQGEGVKTERTDKLAAWIVPGQAPAPDEPSAVWPERRHPMLWLCGDEGSWEKVSQDYLKQIGDRLKNDKSMEELSAKLTAGLTTPAEKAAAIARHVQKDYGYKAIEFGVRARRPNAAAETVKLHYGDCKDFSLLLHHLLRAAGIESHLTLVDTGWRLQPALPSLDQFNHMVVHVPALGPGWLLDATDKTLDLGRFPASYLWHTHALVLDPAKPRLLPPPAAVPSGSCEVASRRTVTPEGRDWSVEETLTVDGYFGSTMRDAFTGLSGDEQSQKAQRILAAQGAAQLEHFRFEHLDDPAKPATLHLTYKVRGALPADGRAAAVPALWERDYLQTTFVKDRRTAFEHLYPMHFTSEITVKLPAEPLPDSLEAVKQQGQSEFCAWKLEAAPGTSSDAATLGLRFEFTTKPGEHPAARYTASHDAWESARRAWDRQISWAGK